MKFNQIQDMGEGDASAARAVSSVRSAVLVERLLRHGVKALSISDLLALVLGRGGRVPADLLATRLLVRWGSLACLAEARPQWLCRERGMGLVRAARLVAAFELGTRYRKPATQRGLLVRDPRDLAPLLENEFRGCDREHFLALYLDTRHRVTAVETVSIGSLNASLVHPREVFRPAIAWGAAAVIAAHNHPSGCARPSGDDLELTARLIRCGRLLGIELLDHIIVAGSTLLSLREHDWPEPDRDDRRFCASVEG